MTTHPTILYRVFLPDRVFEERAIGPSVICAHYPDLVALVVVGSEPKPGPRGELMMGELW